MTDSPNVLLEMKCTNCGLDLSDKPYELYRGFRFCLVQGMFPNCRNEFGEKLWRAQAGYQTAALGYLEYTFVSDDDGGKKFLMGVAPPRVKPPIAAQPIPGKTASQVESLGPKPTVVQLDLLTKLAVEGVTIHWAAGIRGAASAWLVSQSAGVLRERVRTDILDKFKSWGWVEAVGDPAYSWRSNKYVLTEKGLKVIKKEETR